MTIGNSLILTGADNAFGTIGAVLTVAGTSLTFTTGHGARFPAVAAGQILYACLLNANNVLEEIQITAHTNGADSATIVRAVNGTTALVWNSGDRIECRFSSELLRHAMQEALLETTMVTGDGGATYTGTLSPAALAYVKGMIYPLTLSTSNSGATPTIALNGLAAITVVLDGGGALTAGQMPKNGLYKHDGTNFILLNPLNVPGTTATTFTWNGSGSTSGSVTLTWQKVGNFVTLNIPAVAANTGTGSTNFISDTALPVSIRPVGTNKDSYSAVIVNNGAVISPAGLIRVQTNGFVLIIRDGIGSSFTNSASAGLSSETTVTYFTG